MNYAKIEENKNILYCFIHKVGQKFVNKYNKNKFLYHFYGVGLFFCEKNIADLVSSRDQNDFNI